MEIQLTFQDMRCREIVNITDGRRLGRIVDIVFDIRGRVQGIVAPVNRKLFFLKPLEDLFIPWCDIRKIGQDVILVELKPFCREEKPPPRPKGNFNHAPLYEGFVADGAQYVSSPEYIGEMQSNAHNQYIDSEEGEDGNYNEPVSQVATQSGQGLKSNYNGANPPSESQSRQGTQNRRDYPNPQTERG